MSHLYSKIASGKRNQESVGFPQSSHFMNGTPSRKIDIFLLRLAKMHSLQQTYNRVSKPPILNPTLSLCLDVPLQKKLLTMDQPRPRITLVLTTPLPARNTTRNSNCCSSSGRTCK